jgi:hypothetical protein
MAVWNRIAGPLGLPSAAPDLDELVTFEAGEAAFPAAIALHRDSLSGTLGRADPDALAALRAAPRDGDALLRMQGGPHDGAPAYAMHATLDGDSVVIQLAVER